MKTITVNVSEPVYQDFQRHAETSDRTTSELIREAMEEYRDRKLRRRGSLKGLPTYSLGRMRRNLGAKDDLLGEMIGGRP
ncbi:MAG: ribbon-helix-helix protein, CopG family [Opitutaceae bacterium]